MYPLKTEFIELPLVKPGTDTATRKQQFFCKRTGVAASPVCSYHCDDPRRGFYKAHDPPSDSTFLQVIL
jgi:hypothetical protein